MRIGMMADVYKPVVSGVTNYIYSHKKQLELLGHQVYIFTFESKDYIDDEPNVIRSPAVPVRYIKAMRDIGVNFRYTKQARRLLKTMDVVHVHHPLISGVLSLTYCKPAGIPILFTNHTRYDMYAHAYLSMLPEGFSDLLIKSFLSPLCQSVDLVTVPSHSMQEIFHHMGITTPVEVVPNGIDLRFFYQPTGSVERARSGFAPQDIIIVYVGRLSPEKNLPFLLRSFNGVCQVYDDVGLLLVGDGPDRENLEDIAGYMGLSHKIRFTGMIPYEELPAYLAASDIFVTPSVAETFGLSLVEAMAAGLPVLGIDSTGVRDIIEDGVTGFLADNDLASFTAKLIRLATDEALRHEMGKAAIEASKQYSIEVTTAKLFGTYQRLVIAKNNRKRSLGTRLRELIFAPPKRSP